MTLKQELALLSFLYPAIERRHISFIPRDIDDWAEALTRADLNQHKDRVEQARRSSAFCDWKAWIEKNGIKISAYADDKYPALWVGHSFAPLALTYIGQPIWNELPMLAVVGSRNPMPDSLRWMEWHLPKFFSSTAVGVISGGARGIDTRGHLLSVQNQVPTVAAMPVGLMSRYPDSFRRLEEDIVKTGGAVFSSFAPNWPLHKANFVKRNLLIAAMAKMVLIVEARRRSGTLLTAQAAFELDRTVGAVPTLPLRASGQGSLALLAEGRATLMRDHLDLLASWSLSYVRTEGQLSLL